MKLNESEELLKQKHEHPTKAEWHKLAFWLIAAACIAVVTYLIGEQ